MNRGGVSSSRRGPAGPAALLLGIVLAGPLTVVWSGCDDTESTSEERMVAVEGMTVLPAVESEVVDDRPVRLVGFTKQEMRAAMGAVGGAVRACAGGSMAGTATLWIKVEGSTGRVSDAFVVDRPFAGTPAGSCMARAVRSASFPRLPVAYSSFEHAFTVGEAPDVSSGTLHRTDRACRQPGDCQTEERPLPCVGDWQCVDERCEYRCHLGFEAQ